VPVLQLTVLTLASNPNWLQNNDISKNYHLNATRSSRCFNIIDPQLRFFSQSAPVADNSGFGEKRWEGPEFEQILGLCQSDLIWN